MISTLSSVPGLPKRPGITSIIYRFDLIPALIIISGYSAKLLLFTSYFATYLEGVPYSDRNTGQKEETGCSSSRIGIKSPAQRPRPKSETD